LVGRRGPSRYPVTTRNLPRPDIEGTIIMRREDLRSEGNFAAN
jgi:hypothetical protein